MKKTLTSLCLTFVVLMLFVSCKPEKSIETGGSNTESGVESMASSEVSSNESVTVSSTASSGSVSTKTGSSVTSSKQGSSVTSSGSVSSKTESTITGQTLQIKASEMRRCDRIGKDVLTLASMSELGGVLDSYGVKINEYNEEFFKDNSIVIVFSPDLSSSIKMRVDGMVKNNNEIFIKKTKLMPPPAYIDKNGKPVYAITDDVVYRYIMIEVKKADISNVDKFTLIEKIDHSVEN